LKDQKYVRRRDQINEQTNAQRFVATQRKKVAKLHRQTYNTQPMWMRASTQTNSGVIQRDCRTTTTAPLSQVLIRQCCKPSTVETRRTSMPSPWVVIANLPIRNRDSPLTWKVRTRIRSCSPRRPPSQVVSRQRRSPKTIGWLCSATSRTQTTR